MVVIIDYGVGNLFSLKSSFDAIGVETVVSGDRAVISSADRLILPGVGAFRDAAEKLQESGLSELITSLAGEGKPILGICLGMQLLFDKSYEYGEYTGLGLIKGEIRPIAERVPSGYKVPHMGWNALTVVDKNNPLLKYTKDQDHVYFVHSFAAVNCNNSVIATTEYGVPLTAAVANGNVYGCQFHPEKSGNVGLNILKAFCETGDKQR